MRRRTNGFLGVLILVLAVAPDLFSQTATAPSGDGSAGNPYQIDSLANLYWMTQNPSSWSSSFIQTADIDASSDSTWNSGAGFPGFPPNPTMGQIFEGQYDGQGHTISGLYMSQSGSSQIGLFGELYSGTVKNLGLINVRVTGSSQVGGLVGVSEYGTIDSCYTTGSVSGNVGVGGLVGVQLGGTINYCHSSAAVSGVNGNVGGLVGKNAEYDPTNNLGSSTISNSYATGNVSGTASVAGGLVGYNEQHSSISGCYATGNVTAGAFTGGFAGSNDHIASIQGSYATGRVSGTNTVGGFVGSNTGASTITTCHSTGNVVSSGGVSGGFAGENSPDQNSGVASYIATSYSTGIDSASGTDDNGGFAGINSNSEINQCFSSGGVFGRSYVGGLVGNFNQQLALSGIEIINSYSSDSVIATGNYVGGFIGQVSGSIGNVAQVTVIYCYSWGKVTASDTSTGVGGLVGFNDGYSTSNCFWDTLTSGQTTSGTGDIPESTTAMKTPSTFTNAGWNVSTWYIDGAINNGYPYLSWQNLGGAPLPVEMATFGVSSAGSDVKVKWTTATEVNDFGFDIERREMRDQISDMSYENAWTSVGFVKGMGSSNAPHEYSFMDNGLAPGLYSYRIKQIDRSGSFTYSKEVQVHVGSAPRTFSLSQNYPNPFNPTTTIEFTIPTDGRVTLRVYDITGRLVATPLDEDMKAEVFQQVTLDASRLASGVYFYRLQAGSQTAVKKLVLLK